MLHCPPCCSRRSATHCAAANDSSCMFSEGSMSSFKSITWNKLWSQYIALRQLRIWDSRSVGNMSKNVCAKFHCAPLRIKKALGIFREQIPTTTRTTTTRVAFWDPPSGSKKQLLGVNSGFPCILESPWVFPLYSRLWKYLKTGLVLESSWIWVSRSLKVLEFS